MSDELSISCNAENGCPGVEVVAAVRSPIIPMLLVKLTLGPSVRQHPFGGCEGVGKLAAIVVECYENEAGGMEHRILPK